MNRVISIIHNGFSYNIEYDIWGNVSNIRVGEDGLLTGKNLVTYTYGTGANKNRLQKATYSNGGYVEYTYDNNNGNIIRIDNANGSTSDPHINTYRYFYDSQGNVIAEYDEVDNELVRASFYCDNAVAVYSISGLEYYAAYDENGNLSESINGCAYTTQSYDTTTIEDTNETVYKSSVSNSQQTVGMIKTNDTFGRTTQKTLLSKVPSDEAVSSAYTAVLTNYKYKTYNKDNKTMASSQVDTVKNVVSNGTTLAEENVKQTIEYAYDYDNNNNITYEYAVATDGTRTIRYHYTYDEANQLVRVDDNVNNKTLVYAYDRGGNRTSTKTYAYTLGTLGTVQSTVSQTYGVSVAEVLNGLVWTDRLKSYNGKEITYDLEGNPTSYDGKTYIWNGKQLTQITAANGTYTQYNYDINGLRTQKRQYKADNSLEYVVDYIWSDGKIVTQSLKLPFNITISGNTNTQCINIDSKFIYADGEDSPSAIMLNNDEYLLVRDLQGDVTAVVNGSNGETIVEFSYDAWGNITCDFCDEWEQDQTDEEIEMMRMMITVLCPVTYRGYNYDFTTGLYYLQSRYYNSEWGRFLNNDDTSILLSSTETTPGANMYAYCDNNPVMNVDYTGNSAEEIKYNAELLTMSLAFYVVLENKSSILPKYYNTITKRNEFCEAINIKYSIDYSNGKNGCFIIKYDCLYRDAILGNVNFNFTVDISPNYEWNYFINSGLLYYSKIGLNEGEVLYGKTIGPISNGGIPVLSELVSVGSFGFSVGSKLINRIPEDESRRFVRAEMIYQKQHWDTDDITYILSNYESYRIKYFSGHNRKVDYKYSKGSENFEEKYKYNI